VGVLDEAARLLERSVRLSERRVLAGVRPATIAEEDAVRLRRAGLRLERLLPHDVLALDEAKRRPPVAGTERVAPPMERGPDGGASLLSNELAWVLGGEAVHDGELRPSNGSSHRHAAVLVARAVLLLRHARRLPAERVRVDGRR